MSSYQRGWKQIIINHFKIRIFLIGILNNIDASKNSSVWPNYYGISVSTSWLVHSVYFLLTGIWQLPGPHLSHSRPQGQCAGTRWAGRSLTFLTLAFRVGVEGRDGKGDGRGHGAKHRARAVLAARHGANPGAWGGGGEGLFLWCLGGFKEPLMTRILPFSSYVTGLTPW